MNVHVSYWEEGQGLVEYALILVLVAVAVILAVTMLGGRIHQVFAQISLQLANPGAYSGPPLSVNGVGVSPTLNCLAGNCDLQVSPEIDPPVSDLVCVQISVSGSGSTKVCGSPPSHTFTGVPSSGDVTTCVIGVENHTLTGGATCSTTSYP